MLHAYRTEPPKCRKPPVYQGFSCGRYWDRTCQGSALPLRQSPVPGRRFLEGTRIGLREVATGFEPVWTALQAAASPLGHATT
jgi:hypothetical protein